MSKQNDDYKRCERCKNYECCTTCEICPNYVAGDGCICVINNFDKNGECLAYEPRRLGKQ